MMQHSIVMAVKYVYLFQESVEMIEDRSSCSRIQKRLFGIIEELSQFVNDVLGSGTLICRLYANQALDWNSKPNQQPVQNQSKNINVKHLPVFATIIFFLSRSINDFILFTVQILW